jgi:hypothetical protein
MSKRILVVEDQPDNRQITEAENGEEALAAIAKQRPDLILMDIQLPIIDGYTAVSRIKADPALRLSRLSRSPPMRSMGKKRRRARPDVMTMCRNLLARANCWRKFANTCNSPLTSIAALPLTQSGHERLEIAAVQN